jgi:leucyl/phenylalanyl-tRNA---protein transferase
MPVFLSRNTTDFPDVSHADFDGLLAIGGNLSQALLLKAYKKGIFPWYNENEPICWYSPNPRFVLFPEKVKISTSMKSILKKETFDFYIDKDFSGVINNCRLTLRKGAKGTWITDDIENAYKALYESGFAHSAEAWENNVLVGGLYGVRLGKVFFGESMFANESNASKFAFIKFIQFLEKQGVEMIDCQVYTPHLESLGAVFISRESFIEMLDKLIV